MRYGVIVVFVLLRYIVCVAAWGVLKEVRVRACVRACVRVCVFVLPQEPPHLASLLCSCHKEVAAQQREGQRRSYTVVCGVCVCVCVWRAHWWLQQDGRNVKASRSLYIP